MCWNTALVHAVATHRNLTLGSLGAIDDTDMTWLNGTAIGTTFDWGGLRAYEVPANLLKAGENTLLVNVHNINTRGTFLCSKLAIPFLRTAENPHVLNLSSPLNMETRWFQNHVAYTMAKFGMSMYVLGMSEEFRNAGIAFNALWPRTAIATAAVSNLVGGDPIMERSRTVDIMADAAHVILTRNSREFSGNFCVDQEVLEAEGVSDFSRYRFSPDLSEGDLVPDFFI